MTDHSVPPTHADMLDDISPRPAWPKVIGIISIVWGSLGIVCNGFGIVSPLIFGPMMKSAAEQMKGGMPPAITDPNPLMMGLYAVGLVWSILLIVAGAMTVARQPAARPLHLVWAITNTIIAIGGIYFTLRIQSGIADWVRDNPTSDFAQSYSPGSGMIGLAFGLVLGFAWPLFVMVWFLFVKRTNADITEGVEAPVA